MNEVAHAGSRPVLSYDFGKSYDISVDAFAVTQSPEHRGGGPGSHAEVRLFEDGTTVLDISVSGSSPDPRGLHDGFTVAAQDIKRALLSAFDFCSRFYDRVDAFGRHQRFVNDLVLHGLGHRTVSHDPTPKQSFRMRMKEGDVTAFIRPRLVNRRDLGDASSEVEAALTMINRQLDGA